MGCNKIWLHSQAPSFPASLKHRPQEFISAQIDMLGRAHGQLFSTSVR